LKNRLPFLASMLVVFSLVTAALSASAGAIVYDVDLQITNSSNGTISRLVGWVETDGTLGALSNANITDYSLNLTISYIDGAVYSPFADNMTPADGYFVTSGGCLQATPTMLSVDTTDLSQLRQFEFYSYCIDPYGGGHETYVGYRVEMSPGQALLVEAFELDTGLGCVPNPASEVRLTPIPFSGPYVFATAPPADQAIAVDIHPGSCPNPLSTRKQGVIPVAILGTQSFDVNSIDPTTIRLEGVYPNKIAYGDVSTPFNGDLCGCSDAGPDGDTDLLLKFSAPDVLAQLGAVTKNQEIELTVTGQLADGTDFEASDCMIIRGNVVKPAATEINWSTAKDLYR
jgi:hypothetical protein